VSRTKFKSNDGHPARSRVLAASALVAASALALCLAVASRNPLRPLRAFTRWTLERNGARFLTRDVARLQSSLDDCGPTALADLIEMSGLPVPSAETLRKLAVATPSGTTLGNLASAASSAGLRVFTVRWDPVDIDQLPLPSLAWVERRHFVVVARRSDGDSLEVHDPAVGHYRMSIERFATIWSGAALVTLDRISPRGGPDD
jgi:predicted double-glycine peptidase